MSETALFIGWGQTYPGREQFGLKHFAEFIEILDELKTAGEIERYETVLLTPHGGELDGFTLVYGEPEKLASLQMREDVHGLQLKSMLDQEKFSVIWATTGEGVTREFARFREILTEYERQPALV